MYHIICYILLIFGQLQNIRTSYIKKDTATNPFVFHQDREIEIETSKVEFSYQIDLSIINELKNEFNQIQNICPTSPYLGQLYGALFYNKAWNKITHKNFPIKNLYLLSPEKIQKLEMNRYNFKIENDTEIKCKLLSSTTKQLFALNNDFENLNKSIFTEISNFIPIEILQRDTYNSIKKSNLTSPLDFSHWFIVNFYKYTEISIKIGKKYAFLTINTPLFAHATLSKIYLKPILHNNIPYISNSRSELKLFFGN